MVKCPACNGFGVIPARCHPIKVDCDVCRGLGLVEDYEPIWKSIGSMMRDYRIDVLRMSLREAAIKFGVDASNLSKYERGVIKGMVQK